MKSCGTAAEYVHMVRTLVQDHLESKRVQTGQRAKAAFGTQSQPQHQH